jgi:hypothetical protein
MISPVRNERYLAQALTLSILVLLLHSVVDYPLRTAAMMTMFAAWCGIIFGLASRNTSGAGGCVFDPK